MSLAPARPDAEDFRALARSSPWRWRTVRFTAQWSGPFAGEPVRSWIERPDRIRVEALDGQVRLDERQDPGPSVGFLVAFDEAALADEPRLADPGYRATLTADVRRDAEEARREARAGDPAGAVLDEQGLVRRRLTDRFDHDAPMYQTYHWVAMLDPVELADGQFDQDDPDHLAAMTAGEKVPPGTVIDEVRVVEHEGRPAWEAVLRTTAAYDPRCSCCALLPCEVVDLADDWRKREGDYPDAYRVRLDVGTGICVYSEEIGGERAGTGHSLRIESAGDNWARGDPPWRRG
ncbi:hypothetical protein EXU48_06965 [Occultella glacieicola]|uniref:Uncharacterized protein n=1 Tax=Occultella glacieicola TaxID=2518684 RepID=A0ABY2EAU0_9MICO|nr:hypothetical protein [Occultella glacieicola]TDE95980.1 hypothetical protein EXU48_06965 [Occultella glacieicola]